MLGGFSGRHSVQRPRQAFAFSRAENAAILDQSLLDHGPEIQYGPCEQRGLGAVVKLPRTEEKYLESPTTDQRELDPNRGLETVCEPKAPPAVLRQLGRLGDVLPGNQRRGAFAPRRPEIGRVGQRPSCFAQAWRMCRQHIATMSRPKRVRAQYNQCFHRMTSHGCQPIAEQPVQYNAVKVNRGRHGRDRQS